MEHLIAQYIVPLLESLFHAIGWPGVVIIMALESANIPIPSEITMPLAGWLLIPTGVMWWQAFIIGGFFGALGCLIGSSISYGMGYWGGRPFVERYGKYILVNQKDIDNFDRLFTRWGQGVNFAARLLPIVRTFISFPAGVFKVKFVPFAFLTYIGSFIWCGALALVGWMWGDHWEQILGIMGPLKYPVMAGVVIAIGYYVWHHLRRGVTHETASATE
ncbi:MAG: DedA family protein [Caldilineae bacterium]|nr:DedA family protein [Anaerolineae bacterium]MCB0207151.1 DedA family protein [Anaerolineae bacterium]MCB0252440.1 DedA family protein [Anaerolineae bacterium]MCB9154854.1 DedA family protein [Caldilineae bacterium]